MNPSLLDTVGSSSSVWLFILMLLVFGAVIMVFIRAFVRKSIAIQGEQDKEKRGKRMRNLWLMSFMAMIILFWGGWIVFGAFGPGHRPVDTVPEDEGLSRMFDHVVQPTSKEVDAINRQSRPALMYEMDRISDESVDIDGEMSKSIDRAMKAREGKAER